MPRRMNLAIRLRSPVAGFTIIHGKKSLLFWLCYYIVRPLLPNVDVIVHFNGVWSYVDFIADHLSIFDYFRPGVRRRPVRQFPVPCTSLSICQIEILTVLCSLLVAQQSHFWSSTLTNCSFFTGLINYIVRRENIRWTGLDPILLGVFLQASNVLYMSSLISDARFMFFFLRFSLFHRLFHLPGDGKEVLSINAAHLENFDFLKCVPLSQIKIFVIRT